MGLPEHKATNFSDQITNRVIGLYEQKINKIIEQSEYDDQKRKSEQVLRDEKTRQLLKLAFERYEYVSN